MSKKVVQITILSVLLIILSSFTYFNFAKYQPKILKKIHEVKGLSNIITDDTPYPADAVKIGSNQTPNSIQTTFKTGKTQPEVQEFYKNVFSSKKWKLITEKTTDHTLTFAFKKEEETVTVVVTPQEDMDYTFVSIETLTK